MQRREFKRAVEQLQAARGILLEDAPNVMLLARLAHAQLLAGDNASARRTLAEAEIAVPVLAGVYVCKSFDQGTALIDRLGRAVETRGLDTLVAEMCSPAYEDSYGNWTLEGVTRLAALIRVLEQARKAIQEPSR